MLKYVVCGLLVMDSLCFGATNCPVTIAALSWNVAPPMLVQEGLVPQGLWFEIKLVNKTAKEIDEVQLGGELQWNRKGNASFYQNENGGGGPLAMNERGELQNMYTVVRELPFDYYVQNLRQKQRVTKRFPSRIRWEHRANYTGLVMRVRNIFFADGSRWVDSDGACERRDDNEMAWRTVWLHLNGY